MDNQLSPNLDPANLQPEQPIVFRHRLGGIIYSGIIYSVWKEGILVNLTDAPPFYFLLKNIEILEASEILYGN